VTQPLFFFTVPRISSSDQWPDAAWRQKAEEWDKRRNDSIDFSKSVPFLLAGSGFGFD